MITEQEYNYLVGVTHQEHCKTDVNECVCSGGGWFLTDFDTWEKCPIHYTKDCRYPEFDLDQD